MTHAAVSCQVLLFLEEHNQPTTGPVWFSLTQTWVTCDTLQGRRVVGEHISRLTNIHKPFTKKGSVDPTGSSARLRSAQQHLIQLISLSVFPNSRPRAANYLQFICNRQDT